MSEFSNRSRKSNKGNKRIITICLIPLLFIFICFIVVKGINNREASTIAPTETVEATIPAASKPTEAINSNNSSLELWTPQKVDAAEIPIHFSYTSDKAESISIKLQIKPEGAEVFQDAALNEANTSIQTEPGKHTYHLQWNKESDHLAAAKKVDMKLIVTAQDAAPIEDEILHVQFAALEVIRNHMENYLIYYGIWTDAQIDEVKQKYQMVILNLSSGISPEQIQRLRAGSDRHDASKGLVVLGYISVGEDSRTAGMTAEQMKLDPRFVLDGTGPSIDPRPNAPFPNGGEIPDNLNVIGKPTGGGYAPFYLNDNYAADKVGAAGIPDMNKSFNAAFVNPGHPEWLKALTSMKLQTEKVAGLKEILTADYGAGFNCDGLFLDTLDTAGPNSFTDETSYNPSEFEWVAKGTQQLVKNIRVMFPDKFLVANRGLTFYHPDFQAYKFTLRGTVDFVMYESFRLDSNKGQWFNEAFFNDNKYNYVQKLLTEADRSDGFRVLSLGYAEGPEGELATKALHGEKNTATQQLLDDVKETSQLGMLHYITNAALTDINTYVLDNRSKISTKITWGSTKSPQLFGKPFDGPREGLQKLEKRGKEVWVQWDVAHAMLRPISYSLFIKADKPFDFTKDLESQSKRMELPLGKPTNYYGIGDRGQRFPYEAKVEGLEAGKTYYFLLRAKDRQGKYDTNEKPSKIIAP